jgi:hypothetical protein
MLSHQLMKEVDRVCRENNANEALRGELIKKIEAGVEEFDRQNLLGRCSFYLKVDNDGEVSLVGSPLPDKVDFNDGVDPMDAFARDIMRRTGCSREETEQMMDNMHLYRNEGRYELVSDPAINNNNCGCLAHKTGQYRTGRNPS